MRLFLTLFASAALVAVTSANAASAGERGHDDHRRSMGNLRPDSYTAGRAVHGSNRSRPTRVRTVVVPQPYYGGYWDSGYYYDGHRDYLGRWPHHRHLYPRYHRGPIYYAPVVVPPGVLYGPQVSMRFFGAW